MKMRGINSNCGIQAFYDNIAIAMGYKDTNRCRYACSKINVSQSVADNIMDYYRKEGAEESQIAMAWLGYGPKTDESLGEDMIEVQEGFVTMAE